MKRKGKTSAPSAQKDLIRKHSAEVKIKQHILGPLLSQTVKECWLFTNWPAFSIVLPSAALVGHRTRPKM